MALTYPGISYLKGYDGKVSDIFDAWLNGEALGKAQRDEDASGDLIAKLFGSQQGAATAPARSPIDRAMTRDRSFRPNSVMIESKSFSFHRGWNCDANQASCATVIHSWSG